MSSAESALNVHVSTISRSFWEVGQHHSEQAGLGGHSLRLGRAARLSKQLLASTGLLVFVQVTRGTSAATSALPQHRVKENNFGFPFTFAQDLPPLGLDSLPLL